MKIKRLVIENLHSLAGRQEIDFEKEPLKDVGIFAIVGKTGAGKSTILDAITLALYRKLARFGDSKLGTIINEGGIITHGESKAYIELEFEVKNNNYKVIYQIDRNKRTNYLLYKDNTLLSDSPSKVEKKLAEILGIDYHQFILAILLPQGEFDNFLKTTSKERAKILEKLLLPNIYREIGKRIFAQRKELQLILQNEKNNLENFTIKDEKLVKELEQQVKQKSIILSNIKKQLEQTETKLNTINKALENKQQLEQINQELIAIKNELQSLAPQIKQLQKYLSIRQNRKTFDSFFILEQKITELTNDINNKKQEISNLTSKISKLQNKLSILDQQYVDFQENKQQQENKLSQLQSQNNILIELLSSKNELEKLSEQIKNDYKRKVSEYKQTLQKITSLEKEIDKINKWLSDNKLLEQLDQELKLIDSIIFDYKQLYKEILSSINLNKKLPPLELKQFIDNSYNSINAQIAKLKEQLPQTYSLNELIQQKELILQQKSLLEQIINWFNEKQKLLNEIKNNTEQINAAKTEIEKLQQDLKYYDLEVQKYEHLLKAEELEEHLASLRKTLKEGEPCPLCGSTHHPYTKEQKFKQLTVTNKQVYQQKLNQAKDNFQKTNNKLIKYQTKIEELNKLNDNLQDKVTDFELNIKKVSEQLQISYSSSLDYYHNIAQKLQQKALYINEQIQLIEKLNQLEKQLKDLDKLIEKTNKLSNIYNQLQDFKIKYQKYATATTLDKFQELLNKAVKSYKKASELLQNYQQNLASETSKLSSIQNNIDELKTKQSQIQTELSNLNNQIDSVYKQIYSILGFEVAPLTPKMLKSYIEREYKELQEKEKQFINSINDIKSELKSTQELKSRLLKEIELKTQQLQTLNEQANNISEQIENIIQQNPLISSIDEVKQIIEKEEQILKFQEFFEQLQTKQKTLEQQKIHILDIYKVLLQQLSIKEEQLSQLKQQIDEKYRKLDSDRSNLIEEIGRINEKIEMYKNEYEKFKQQQQKVAQLEQEYYKINLLNDFIGDSEGNKFVSLVLKYVVDRMLVIANRYLDMFLPRYELKLKATDKHTIDFTIIDKDMANMERTIKSLSGGEKFLVSLSLALALSALASSKMDIENMFIDEGFGSLDNESLDMVLSALEKLQHKSQRKIGVISHVEAMKERIPVKILVEKKGQGRSRIKVVAE